MAKVRVYELAKEFGVESKTVMVKLQEMGEFVRSASSTIEAPVVRRLKEAFSAQQPKQGRADAVKDGRPAAQTAAGASASAASAPSVAQAPGTQAPAAEAPSTPSATAPAGAGSAAADGHARHERAHPG